MKGRSSIVLGILIVILLITIGFVREFLFANIHAQLEGYEVGGFYRSIIGTQEPSTLINIKWVLTFGFISMYLSTSTLLIHLIFKVKKFTMLMLWVYGSLLSLAALIYLIGMVVNLPEGGYQVAHSLALLLQSPIPAMILIPVLKIRNMFPGKHAIKNKAHS